MNEGHIVKQGYLRRLKTQKRRYFILRSPLNGTARLEYFESEKRFRQLQSSPKRTISLASCFNIGRKEDWKNKFVFALYTRDDVFGLIADSDEEMNAWLKCLWEERNKSEIRSDYVSMWHVTVKPRGLGTSKNLAGHYDLKLTNQSISFLKRDTNKLVKELKLVNIRRCGHTDCFFFMELGRSAITGAGEIWMQVDDQVIAQNMHEAIYGTMQNLSMSDLSLQGRLRTGTRGVRGLRGRPSSAFILPTSRARAESMPDSPTARRRTASSSTNRLGSSSPKMIKPNMLSRLRPKRRGREDNWPSPSPRRLQSKSLSIDAAMHGEYLGKAHSVMDFSLLASLHGSTNGLASPVDLTKSCDSLFSSSPPGMSSTNDETPPSPLVDQPDYVNSSPSEIGGSADYYMKMGGASPKETGPVPGRTHYMDMERGSETETGEVKFQPAQGKQLCDNQDVPDGGVKPANSPSPKQLRTSEQRGSPHLEVVNIKNSPKSSPSPARPSRSHDYIAMAPGTLRASGDHCYMNFCPAAQSQTETSACDGDSHTYMNFCPGGNLRSPSSESVTERRRYVNFDPNDPLTSDSGKRLDFDQAASSSAYPNGAHTYVNFVPGQPAGRAEQPGNLDSRTYVNLTPGDFLCAESGLASDVHAMKIAESPPKSPASVYVNLDFSEESSDCAAENPELVPREEKSQPGDPILDKVSRKGNRRRSEPVNSSNNNPEKVFTFEDETPLTYVMLDLGNGSPAGSPKRQRPPNINLVGCSSAARAPKSAPAHKSYVEIDFTKSQGLRQARLKSRESTS